MAVAVTRSEAIAMCCARRTARGQCGQVGVEKTLMSTSPVSAASEAFVASESVGLAAGRDDDRVDQVAELVAARNAVEADAVVARALHHDGRHLVDAVGLGPLAVDGGIEHLDADAVVERGDLAHELLVLPAQLAGHQLLREDHQLHGTLDALELLADGAC